MSSISMEHLNGPVILSGFLMSSVVYWHAFFLVNSLLRKYAPTIHQQLKSQDELRKLCPLILVIVRMAFGLTISLPACAQAARTTEWGVNQPLNTAGQVCVVSQLAVWSNELPLIRFYSLELFIHHILCLLATSNIILSPLIHQIKPLYIFFASLVGDIGPGSVMILRMAGYHLKTSRLMYYVSLGSTLILIFCRIGGAFYTLTQVLTDPYNLADWVWALAVLLFGCYSAYCAFLNLRRLGIIKLDPEQYKVTYCCRVTVPVSHSFLAVACGVTLLSTLFLYGIFLDRPLKPLETHRLSFHGLIAVSVGLSGALIARIVYPYHVCQSNPWGCSYVPFGTILTGIWISITTKFSNYSDRDTILASTEVNIPLFFALARVAQYYSAKDAEATRDKKQPLNDTFIKKHIEMARGHAVTFTILMTLLIFDMLSLPEAARLSLSACLVIQLRYRRNIVPLAATKLHGTPGVMLAILLSLLEPGFVAFITTGKFIRHQTSLTGITLNYMLLGGTVLAAITISASKTASMPCETVRKPCRSQKCHPVTILFVFFCILQAMLVRKYITFGEDTPEVCLGFKNFRSILSDPFTWIGLLHMASLPVVLLRELE
ncbi:hypothetical protein F53441_9838 [Fusarium austroafricanum]|uniref:Uncharacterized protein n=1 Tax=Fusarium austroafricanum TaxID=2364996 RepID=A0A8H4KC17_9HYPO|nr:hypothetical protein F53441_9838 [Fusarium austroafricanum]